MLKSHTLLIILLVFLQTVSCIALILSYTQYKESQFERESYNNKSGQFSINNVDESVKTVQEKINTIENNCNLTFDCIEFYFNEEMTIKAVPTKERKAVSYGNDFNNADESEVIVPLEMQLKNVWNIGDRITILDKEYTIAGVRKATDFEIEFETVSSDMKVKDINLILPTIPTKKEIDKINKYINNNFTDSTVSLPQERNLAYELSLDSKVVIMALLVIISVANINFIYEYLIEQRNKINSIYRICGLSKIKMIIISLSEFVVYTFFSTFIALMSFDLLIKDSLHMNSIVPYDYIIPTAFYVIVSIYSGFEKIVISLKKDPVNYMSEGL